MLRPTYEVADIFRQQGPRYRAQHRLPPYQLRLMRAIELCRTAALGGHVERCGHCHHQRISYNSCRNRHCPKCQNLARAQWLEQRKDELLSIDYYHLVFTIPEPLNAVALQNKALFYRLLFETSAATLQTIAADPQHLGAQIGFFSILHTWGQKLLFHPHIHCVATGGGISPDRQRWLACRPGFFLSVRVLSRLFRRLFLEALEKAFRQKQIQFHGQLLALSRSAAFQAFLAPLRQVEWVVYAKPPFGGPARVLEYLGRYTHRVALTNQRLQSISPQHVTFQFKDYRAHGRQKSRQITIAPDEFIRRFLLHALPPGFTRIRHYGLFASRGKKANLLCARQLLRAIPTGLLPSRAELSSCLPALLASVLRCPVCTVGIMVRTDILPRLDSS